MMTFEEFFRKKKINLPLLQSSEPALFAEFENHYGQMGEKSFDHTKKYWFNQLRRRFPAPIESKIEKVIIENQLAEQTIADTLTEPATSTPNVGFKPRFKAGATVNKPVDEQPKADEEKPTEVPASVSSPGFKPRFKASMVAKPIEEKPAVDDVPAAEVTPTADAEKPTATLGFKPKFKAATPPKPAEETAAPPKTDSPAEEPKPALGFKPKFRAAAPPKPVTKEPATPLNASEENKKEALAESNDIADEEKPKPALGFKPKFRAATPPKPETEKTAAAPMEPEKEEATLPATEEPTIEPPKPIGLNPAST